MKKLITLMMLYTGITYGQTTNPAFDFSCITTLGDVNGQSLTTPCGEVLEWQTGQQLGLFTMGGWGNGANYIVYRNASDTGWIKQKGSTILSVNGVNGLLDNFAIADVFADWNCE